MDIPMICARGGAWFFLDLSKKGTTTNNVIKLL